jgi:hypothetical protein
MIVGVTGHQRLGNPSDWDWVEREINALLRSFARPLVGITCLAIGADQLFANAVFQNNGTIEAVIPFPEYEMSFDGAGKLQYQQLLGRASKITILQRKASADESYLEAGKMVVDSSDIMLGVWDGNPAAGLGGTADIVEYAISRGTSTIHINPLSHIVRTLCTES